jgi:predicted AlkP superfamily pyrophosphatase or phosphodiesterase
VIRYFTRAQLVRGAIPPADPLARRILHGFYPSRSGDVVVVYEPFNYFEKFVLTTAHGSPYSYDTHVPLIIMGGGLKAGSHMEAATPADIAPTLASILGVQAPSNAVGRILIEGFAAAGTRR